MKYYFIFLLCAAWFEVIIGQVISSVPKVSSNAFGLEIFASPKSDNVNTFRIGTIGLKKISNKFQVRYGLGISNDRYSEPKQYTATTGVNALFFRDTNFTIDPRRSSFAYIQLGADYQIGMHRIGVMVMPSYWLGYAGRMIKSGNAVENEITEGFLHIRGVDAYHVSTGIYYLFSFTEWASISTEVLYSHALENEFKWAGKLLGRNAVNFNLGFVFHFN